MKELSEFPAAPSGSPPKRQKEVEKPPPRMEARWGVFDIAGRLAVSFPYNDKPAAEVKLTELLDKAKREGYGTYYLAKHQRPMGTE